MKKRIGIVGRKFGENTYGAQLPYLSWLSQFGEITILTPSMGIVEDLDLLVLPGGPDMLPSSYGEAPGYFNNNADQFQQHFYNVNLRQYIEAGTNIIGICLGFQQLSSFYGGKLNQHFPFPYSAKHRTELVEALDFESMFVNDPNPKVEYKVNSLHHQGIFELPEGCTVIARSVASNNIEIAKFAENIYGFQYHPKLWGSC